MRPKIRCDGKSTVLLQNFLDLNWAVVCVVCVCVSRSSLGDMGQQHVSGHVPPSVCVRSDPWRRRPVREAATLFMANRIGDAEQR
jgi:hypothetical protein